MPAGEKAKQMGIIKPKLYSGETYKIKSADRFEKIEDKIESVTDRFEDKFELQKQDD